MRGDAGRQIREEVGSALMSSNLFFLLGGGVWGDCSSTGKQACLADCLIDCHQNVNIMICLIKVGL